MKSDILNMLRNGYYKVRRLDGVIVSRRRNFSQISRSEWFQMVSDDLKSLMLELEE